MTALAPKMTPDGSVFLVIRPHVKDGVLSDYVLRTRLALREAGWKECEELVWIKPNAPPLGSKLRPRRAWESILWFSPCSQPYADLKACGKESDRLGFSGDIRFAESGVSEKTAWHPCVESFGKGNGVARITDVIVANVGGNEPGLDHPAVFPLALAEQLVKTFSQSDDLVLDPFCGSGQTLLAAKGCGRRYLGIEREAEVRQDCTGAAGSVRSSAYRLLEVHYVPTDSASLRFFRQRIASLWASSNRQRIASLCVSHDVFPPWSTG